MDKNVIDLIRSQEWPRIRKFTTEPKGTGTKSRTEIEPARSFATTMANSSRSRRVIKGIQIMTLTKTLYVFTFSFKGKKKIL